MMTHTPFTVELQEVFATRNYRKVFMPISVTLTNGSALYLEGENGAGKTTLLRIICGLNQQYQGALLLNELERREWANLYTKNILYIGHSLGLKEDLTPLENIESLLSIRQQSALRSDILKVFTQLSLPTESRALRYLSAGQKRRVALSRLMFESAPIWILDEPFTALDKYSIAWLESRMIAHQKEGGAIIFTSHQSPSNNVYNMHFILEPYIHHK